jgi:hypothetical protein
MDFRKEELPTFFADNQFVPSIQKQPCTTADRRSVLALHSHGSILEKNVMVQTVEHLSFPPSMNRAQARRLSVKGTQPLAVTNRALECLTSNGRESSRVLKETTKSTKECMIVV